jgi:hypothetical protein
LLHGKSTIATASLSTPCKGLNDGSRDAAGTPETPIIYIIANTCYNEKSRECFFIIPEQFFV